MKHGFTLLELAVVVAIVAALATLGAAGYQRMLHHGRSAACLANLRDLGAALNLYLGEHDLKMPALAAGRRSKDEEAQVIDNTLNHYARNQRVFACPDDHRRLAEFTGTSYYWNTALNGQSAAALSFMKFIKDHHRIPVLADKEGFHPYEESKVNLLFADGHVTKELSFFAGQ